ncbi:hypothetical protein [Amnibacterium sp.]|uniref:hypothetical protein n=1 Tax=Amnibacterium sp. TaxID=1872496 RepID=UPI003F7BFF51
MTDQHRAPRSRRGTSIIVGVLLLVAAAVVTLGLLANADRSTPAAAFTTAAPVVTDSSASESPSVTPTRPAPTRTPKPTAAPTRPPVGAAPQPTRTASITRPTAVPIAKELTASVAKMEAVTGTAQGPGEIGGPAVRFTIVIKNTTGRSVSLSNTVVNAYYGAATTPAVQLQSPGGRDFPASVADGGTAQGVFVFNIPTAGRSQVKVTVDTSVQNPVIAFSGAAPR